MLKYLECKDWIDDRGLEDEDWVKDRGLRQNQKRGAVLSYYLRIQFESDRIHLILMKLISA